jgi:hypothetical protein
MAFEPRDTEARHEKPYRAHRFLRYKRNCGQLRACDLHHLRERSLCDFSNQINLARSSDPYLGQQTHTSRGRHSKATAESFQSHRLTDQVDALPN